MALYTIYRAVSLFIHLLQSAIFIYVLCTWIVPRSPVRYWLENFIRPFCAPFRPMAHYVMRRWGAMFDLTCWFTMFGLQILQWLLGRIFMLLIQLF